MISEDTAWNGTDLRTREIKRELLHLSHLQSSKCKDDWQQTLGIHIKKCFCFIKALQHRKQTKLFGG
jgi:hypothetical protein